ENLTGHLLSPEFFDAERNPELRFESKELRTEGNRVTIDGDLTLKGVTKPVELRGELAGPISDAYGGTRLGLDLETTVDRTEFGPPAAAALRDAIAGADAVVFATPEYNSSIPGQLKNAVDWASRPFRSGALWGKPVVVIGASSGMYGGVWAQAELRKALGTAG